MQPKFARVKITTPNADGTVTIASSSYRDELHSYREEIEQSILTSHSSLLNDVIKCLRAIQDHNTPVLTIEIHMDAYSQPQRIVQKFITSQKYYGK